MVYVVTSIQGEHEPASMFLSATSREALGGPRLAGCLYEETTKAVGLLEKPPRLKTALCAKTQPKKADSSLVTPPRVPPRTAPAQTVEVTTRPLARIAPMLKSFVVRLGFTIGSASVREIALLQPV
jgi:hypothetical protein